MLGDGWHGRKRDNIYDRRVKTVGCKDIFLSFLLRSIIDRRRVICFYFGQITELLSFFPRTNENNRTIIDFLERCSAVRTKKNKKKSLIGIHTAPDISSSAPPLQISVTFDG